jgi:outer membrane protein OmpA-like peptidoglycan-associated protein
MKFFSSKMVLFYFIAINLSALYSLDFQFKYKDGDNYRIVTEVYENVKENGRIIYSTEILNRIAVSIENSDENSGEIHAVYQISERESGGSGYHWSSEDNAVFRRSTKGEYSFIPENQSLPSVRNIPRFPDKNLEPGDRWFFPAEEVHDLLPFFMIDFQLHIPFRVFYTYEGSFVENNKVYDRILINYNMYYEQDPVVTAYEHPGWGRVFPEKIVGSFNQEYIWDRDAGRPSRVEDEFEYTYTLSTGESYTFAGVSYGHVIKAEAMDKDQMVQEIMDELENEGVKDIRVTPEDEGVRITMEDIRFLPDSPVLEQSEIVKLERISTILQRYRDRDVLISGHTARFGTEESSQKLSEERAAAVATYLLEQDIREESEIVTRGYGSRQPVGDNTTIEGQKLNRRVEITILEN